MSLCQPKLKSSKKAYFKVHTCCSTIHERDNKVGFGRDRGNQTKQKQTTTTTELRGSGKKLLYKHT